MSIIQNIYFKVILIVFKLIILLSLIYMPNAIAHSPHDMIDSLDLTPSYEKDKTLFAIVNESLMKSSDGGFSWKRLVNGLNNKYKLSHIEVSPFYSFDQTLLVSSGDGIYMSEDCGSSWFKVNKGISNLNIGLVAISPMKYNDKIILAAGTEGGAYKSKDWARNWYQVIDDSIKVTSIAYLTGIDKGHMIIGDHKGDLYISRDNGETWQHYFKFTNSGGITSIVASPIVSQSGTWFVGTEKGGVFIKNDHIQSNK